MSPDFKFHDLKTLRLQLPGSKLRIIANIHYIILLNLN